MRVGLCGRILKAMSLAPLLRRGARHRTMSVLKAESLEQSLPSLKRKRSEGQAKTCDAKTEKVKAGSANAKEAKVETVKAKQVRVLAVGANAKKSDAMTTEESVSKARISRAKQSMAKAETTPAKNQRATTAMKSATKPKALFTTEGDIIDEANSNTKAKTTKKEAEPLSNEPPKPDWRHVYDLIKE